jgi:hypothetical protein
MTRLPAIVDRDSYIRIVKDKALLRETMLVCQNTIDQCSLASEPSSEILETAAAIPEPSGARARKRMVSGV